MKDRVLMMLGEFAVLWSYMILWPFIDMSFFAIIFMPVSLAYSAYILAVFIFDLCFGNKKTVP